MHQSAAAAAVWLHVVPAVLALRASRDSAGLSPRRVAALLGAGAERRSPVAGAVKVVQGSLRSSRPRRASASAQGSQNVAGVRRSINAVTVAGDGQPPFMHVGETLPSCMDGQYVRGQGLSIRPTRVGPLRG